MSGAVSGCVCIQTRQAPRVPLPASRYCLFCSVSSRDTSGGVTLPSSLIRTHAPILSPPNASVCRLVQSVFAGCYQPLLGKGPSRRYLCGSFSTCLDPYPGCSCGALPRFFTQDFGLPRVKSGSAHTRYPCYGNFSRGKISGLQSFAYVQARRVARRSNCSYPLWGSRGFYFRAYLESLPSQVPDILTV